MDIPQKIAVQLLWDNQIMLSCFGKNTAIDNTSGPNGRAI
jgi:hypothetical protein